MFEPRTRVARVAYAAVFTALVAAATILLAVSIPATGGYFNFGEIMVYSTAMLTGPYVGAIAGGVGSAISDALLSPGFAPGTLVIKGLEGFLVGYLYKKGSGTFVSEHWKVLVYSMGSLLALMIAFVGLLYYSGDAILTVSLPNLLLGNYPFSIPYYLWLALSVTAFAGTVLWGRRSDPKIGWTVLSILAGGSMMVLGYFSYELVALRITMAAALAEVPFNVGQVLVGLVTAIFLAESAAAAIKPGEKPAQPRLP